MLLDKALIDRDGDSASNKILNFPGRLLFTIDYPPVYSRDPR